MNQQETNWIPTLHQAQEYNDIVQNGLTFATKQELQNYLDTLYFYEGEADDTVPTDYTDGVWNIIQTQHNDHNLFISQETQQ